MMDNIKSWLEEGTIDVFLGYKEVEGHPLPWCFTRERLDEVDDLVLSPARYSLEKIANHLAEREPGIRIGMLARDCNQRALNVLYVWNQLKREQILTVDVNCCPSRLKDHADCSYLEPSEVGPYKKEVGIDNHLRLEDVESYEPEEGLYRWMYEFQKCIKCYGCRNICPVCFCKECSLDNEELVRAGPLIPDVPIFHLVRAVHMAGRCVDCGLCEDACPMDIPLRLLYQKVSRIVLNLFDYKTGTSADQPPLSILGDRVTLEPKPIQPASGK